MSADKQQYRTWAFFACFSCYLEEYSGHSIKVFPLNKQITFWLLQTTVTEIIFILALLYLAFFTYLLCLLVLKSTLHFSISIFLPSTALSCFCIHFRRHNMIRSCLPTCGITIWQLTVTFFRVNSVRTGGFYGAKKSVEEFAGKAHSSHDENSLFAFTGCQSSVSEWAWLKVRC